MTISENKYKDAAPFDTINVIRKLLYDLGIEVHEESWGDISSECFSVRLEVDGFPGAGNNGKGATRTFALASAYGEIMERLQNKKLFNKSYGLKYNHQTFPDEKLNDIVKFSEENPVIMKHLVGDYNSDVFFDLFRNYPKLSYFSKFHDVFEDKTQWLPSILINMACGTNGMCAGNSMYEALCHGICEILERHVSKEILMNQLVLPEIPIGDIKDQKIIDIIGFLKNAGLDVIIKDCTMGGFYPVVGVLLLDKSRTRYQFRLGSESVFSIALERCLTEVFQGRDIRTFVAEAMLPVEYNFAYAPVEIKENLMKISKDGSGQFPMSIFHEIKATNVYQNAFLTDLENNKQSYDYLLKLLKRNNFKLYVRNLSFSEFPTYKIYIPGMSEIFQNDVCKMERKITINRAANYLLNIKSCKKEELLFLLEEFDRYCSRKISGFHLENSPYFKSTNLHLKSMNDFGKIDLRLIVSLLSYIVGEDKKAVNYFAGYIKSLPDRNYVNLDYYHCIMAFLQLKAINRNDKEICESLYQLFPEKLVCEVLEDFKDRSIGLLSKMPFPSCPDCENCKIMQSCLWKEWEKINTSINQKLAKFNNYAAI